MKLMKKIFSLALVAVAVVTLASCDDDDKAGVGVYSYNTAMTTFPTNWNPHTYQTATDSTILDYTTSAFYTFDYNETKDGYKIVPLMATAEPEDVTADYVGQYGLKEGDTGKAYKITLRDDIKWEDGLRITAQDFVDSAKLLLNPKAANYRADQLYSGNLVVYNAKNYLYQSSHAYANPMVSAAYGDDEYVDPATFTKAEDGTYYVGAVADNKDMAINLDTLGNWSPSATYGLRRYFQAGYFVIPKFDADGNYVYEPVYATDENGEVVKDEEGNPVPLYYVYAKDANGDYVYEEDEEGNPTDVKVQEPESADNKDYVLDEDGNKVVVTKRATEVAPEWTILDDAEDKDGYVVMNEKTLPALQRCIAILHGYLTTEAYAAALQAAGEDPQYAYKEWEEMAFYGYDYPEMDFEEVGLFATSETELVMVLEKKLTGFYLLYSIGGGWLVREDMYVQCEKFENGVYTNSYGTTADKYMSYGPYKLTSFQKDKEIVFEKNPYYFELNDETADPIYQTTKINIQYVAEASTKLQLFNSGKLDVYGLEANDMENYSGSDYVYYQTGASTFYMAMNPDADYYAKWDADAANAGKNKSVLTVKEFRMALSFALNRADFALATAPTNSPAIAMFSSLIISNPEEGTAYRTTEDAKDVVLNFWGLADQVGEGKKYATKDEAIKLITGYDKEGAKALFDEAYDKAVAAGIYNGEDKVQIIIGLPSATSTFYVNGYQFLVNCYTDAVSGTKFQDKLEFVKNDTVGNAFGDRLRDNTVDMLFGVGWTGAALDPYSLITAYTDPSYQYDAGTDCKEIPVDVEIDGKVLRLSLYDWTMKVLQGEPCNATVVGEDGEIDADAATVSVVAGTDADNALRLKIFAASENALLQLYNLIPLIDDASASLKGMKINYYTEEYIFGVGRGGIKYMTYNFDDYEWNKFVKDNGGSLNYQ